MDHARKRWFVASSRLPGVAMLVATLGSPACSRMDAPAEEFGTDGFDVGNRNGAEGGNDLVAADGRVLDVAGEAGCKPNLTGIVRDFKDAHPDFEHFTGNGEKGIVQAAIGADFKPVYASATTTTLTSGRANFDQWYRNVEGINVAIPFTLTLTAGPGGISTFDDSTFFPIDGAGFGNQARPHNFHFTFELHTEFIYNGGEVFTFSGDDDLWTFINRKLAIDLGGLHSSQTATVSLDARAAALGIERGKTYELAVFHAERHTTESHFRIDTTIGFTNCGAIIR